MDVIQEKNIHLYNNRYRNLSISGILEKLKNLEFFLVDATTTDTSWFGLYLYDFRNSIRGKKVLELGCGDCTNAAVMAALGAEVYANDIADSSGDIIQKLNDSWKFEHPIVFIKGDFLKKNIETPIFDFIVGKAFLHHLTLPMEALFLEKCAKLLKPRGEARFLEPAVNSRFLDEIRWYVPVPGRPSKFQRSKFAAWKAADPHPDRSFSTKHWQTAGKKYFKTVDVTAFGCLERFHRLLPPIMNQRTFRRTALKLEGFLPKFFRSKTARSQLIIYKI